MNEANTGEDHIDGILTAWKSERPDLDLEHMGPMMRMAFVFQHVVMPVGEAAMAEHGLQQPEYDVLTTLRRSGEPYALTPSALSAELLMSRAGMTKRLDRLEAAGLVERTPVPGDRRSFLVTLTEAGREAADAAATAVAHRIGQLTAKMPEHELAQLDHALRSMLAIGTRDK
ncbi:MarR family winged helix-turn-helix transcriptional regulator [Glycomyces tritici]|uniref:MarR family transcriptional regulator n=1 Tax=Glycomyces tritici TaxID=2665176 RepID=A0ABT7YXQ9_9ACTN|nr:MarR family transcriptional regulator [Glycomyces tritici]MDN3243431.1 MarR family transcriptional regulator [Glycomyces tritici]